MTTEQIQTLQEKAAHGAVRLGPPTKETILKVKSLHEEGFSVEDIAQEVKRPPSSVENILAKLNAPKPVTVPVLTHRIAISEDRYIEVKAPFDLTEKEANKASRILAVLAIDC